MAPGLSLPAFRAIRKGGYSGGDWTPVNSTNWTTAYKPALWYLEV